MSDSDRESGIVFRFLIAVGITIVIDAGVFYFLIPRMMGSSQYWKPPTLQDCFKYSAIGNGLFLVFGTIGFRGIPLWLKFFFQIKLE